MIRKFLFSILLTCTVASLHAQAWLGGELALRTNSITMDGYKTQSGTYLSIAPEVGYDFSGRWAAALKAGYAYLKHQEIAVLDQTLPGSGNQLSLHPFVRYTFSHLARCHFFADAGPTYTLLQRYGEESLQTIGFHTAMGLRVAISDRVGLTGRLGIISYNHSWMPLRSTTLRGNAFSLDLTSDISFGAYIYLKKKPHDPEP